MLILASASKARRKLLDQVGIHYRTLVSDIDESNYSSSNVVNLAQTLAEEKANSIVSKLLMDKLGNELWNAKAVLGCDSLFEFEGQIFGKPKNATEAIDRWKKMAGSSGILHTGHCLLVKRILNKETESYWGDFVFRRVISTEISFESIRDKDIIKYVESKEPLNCAGGFAIEGKGGIYVREIKGCYSNVIGLSLPWLRKTLDKCGLLDEFLT